MYTAAELILGNFEALLSLVEFVYWFPTTVGIRESYVQLFGPNG